MSCQNNMKQVALATHNYETAFGVIPAMTGSSSYSPQARILPYIEQENLQNLIDFPPALLVGPVFAARYDIQLQRAVSTVVPTFNSPSDAGEIIFRPPTQITRKDSPLDCHICFSNGSGTELNYDDRFATDVWFGRIHGQSFATV